jgi:hypothetical protein
MEELINKIFLLIGTVVALIYLHDARYKFEAILATFFVGFASCLIGIFLIYIFNDTITVVDQLLLKNIKINGKFIIFGYACIITAMFGSIVYILKQLFRRKP